MGFSTLNYINGLFFKNSIKIILAISLGWLLALGTRVVFPAIMPFIQNYHGFSLSISGLLLTTISATYAIGQLPGGMLGDHVGEAKVLVFSSFISGVLLILIAVSGGFGLMFVAIAGFGFATALYGPTRFTIFTRLYSNKAGSAIGFTMAAGSIGSAILPIAAVVIAQEITWQWSIGILAPLFFLASIILYMYIPTDTSDDFEYEYSREILFRVINEIKSDKISVVVIIQALESLVFNGFVSFLPTYLVLSKSLSPSRATTFYALFFVVGAFIQPISGYAKDVIGMKQTLLFTLGISAISIFALTLTQGPISITFIIIGSGSLMGIAVVTQTYFAEKFNKEIKGSGLGLVRTSTALLGSTSPLFIGVLGDYGHLNIGFLILGFCLTLAVMLVSIKFGTY